MNYIIIKGGILKAYEFSDEFIEKNKDLVEKFADLFDELYTGNCCVYGASETHKNNDDIKKRICDMLEIFYDMGIPIQNGFTDEYYNYFSEIKDYIMNYGKEV